MVFCILLAIEEMDLHAGPFELAVGDTQEIVIAQFAEIGIDRLNSLLLLKRSQPKS